MVTSSLQITEQKFLRLRGRVASAVVNALSLLNWRNWLGGKFPVDIRKVREVLLPEISTTLQGTTQDVKVSRFHILIHILTPTSVYSNLLQFGMYSSFMHEVRIRFVIAT